MTTHHNVAQRLLELLLSHALHGEQSQDQLLEKLNILHTKSWKQEPEKESLLLGTLLMQDLSGKRLRKVRMKFKIIIIFVLKTFVIFKYFLF